MYDHALGYDPYNPGYSGPGYGYGADNALAFGADPRHAHPAHPHAHHPAHPHAVPHPHANPHAPMTALAAAAALSAQRIQPVQQRQALPLNSTGNVTANGGTAIVSVLPQRTFQCERFVWGSTSSGFFTLQNLLFGQDSMFVSPGSLDAEIFSQTGMDMSLYGYIAVAGILVTMQVTNTSGADRRANAAVVGGTIV